MATRLFLVRHGETEGSSDQRYWGRTDIELSPLGMRQAERLRDRLASERLDASYSSDLQRAWRTAQTINSAHNITLTPAPELREVDFGELEGLSFEGIQGRYPQARALSLSRSLGGGYPGGDTIDRFVGRVLGFLGRLDSQPNRKLLVVAHSGSLRVLICHLLGMPENTRWQMRLDLASLSTMELRAEGAILLSLNDTCHLID